MNVMLGRRRMLRLSAVATVDAMFGLAGCARRTTVLSPPKIHYGYDPCAWCGMIISDPHFAAAAAYTRNGSPHDACFDDIGCMFAWQHAHRKTRVAAAWVKSCATKKWINAQTAWFVESTAILSPMGYGIAAGATPSQAQLALPQAARPESNAMTYSAIRHFEWSKARHNQPVKSQ